MTETRDASKTPKRYLAELYGGPRDGETLPVDTLTHHVLPIGGFVYRYAAEPGLWRGQDRQGRFCVPFVLTDVVAAAHFWDTGFLYGTVEDVHVPHRTIDA